MISEDRREKLGVALVSWEHMASSKLCLKNATEYDKQLALYVNEIETLFDQPVEGRQPLEVLATLDRVNKVEGRLFSSNGLYERRATEEEARFLINSVRRLAQPQPSEASGGTPKVEQIGESRMSNEVLEMYLEDIRLGTGYIQEDVFRKTPGIIRELLTLRRKLNREGE